MQGRRITAAWLWEPTSYGYLTVARFVRDEVEEKVELVSLFPLVRKGKERRVNFEWTE